MRTLACVTKPGLDHWIKLKATGRILEGLFLVEPTREHYSIFDKIYLCRYSCMLEASPKKLVNSNFGNKAYRQSLAIPSVLFDQMVLKFNARSTDSSAIDIRLALDNGSKDRVTTKTIPHNWIPQTIKIDLKNRSKASKIDLVISSTKNTAEINNIEIVLTSTLENAFQSVRDFDVIAVDDRALLAMTAQYGESILATEAAENKRSSMRTGERPNSPKVSILTLTYNGRHLLQKCAHYLLKNTENTEYEWLILDDHSEDDTEEFFRKELERHKNILYFRPNSRIRNFSKGNNYLARLAKGRYLVFLNNDCYVQPNWLSTMIKKLDNDPTIGMIGSLLLFPQTKTIQHSGVVFLTNGPEQGMPHHILTQESPARHSLFLKRPRMFQAVTAACSAMPKSLFNNLGGYDESFEFGYEDVDLCLRISNLNYKVVFDPTSNALHEQNATHPIAERDHSGWELKKHLNNKNILQRKWGKKVSLDSDAYIRDINFNLYEMREQDYRVTYVPYTRGDGNDIYRTDLMVQSLEEQNIRTSILNHKDPSWPEACDVIVLQRFVNTAMTQEFFRELRRRYPKAIVGYDIDDYIFDKRLHEHVKSSAGMGPEIMDAYRRTMMEADFFLTTTNFLSNILLSTFHKPSFVVPNSLDPRFMAEKVVNKKEIVIGYASGTKTHDNDFLAILGPLSSILTKYANVRLLLLGHLNVPASLLKQFNHRVERHPFVPYDQFNNHLRRFDINIAPLQHSEFTDAKSPLKYIEAGALGIPTVASGTAGYSEIIEDGVNGFLCLSNREWIDKLSNLIESSTLRSNISTIAKRDVVEKYTTATAGKRLNNIFAGMLTEGYQEA